MIRYRRPTPWMFLLVVALLVVTVVGLGVKPAQADLDRSCASDVGSAAPVVFVHGWRSNASAWADAAQRVRDEVGATAVQFDYEAHNTDWVADPAIGPALADLVSCLANNSAVLGGPGKVILVGHSMGGLAIRCALQPSCGGRTGVPDEVLQVITVGTPTHGSFLRYGGTAGNIGRMALSVICASVNYAVVESTAFCGNFLTNDAAVAFNDGSTELISLRTENSSVPVLAIAGDIKVDASLIIARFPLANGDGIVDQRSQQSWSTETATVDCGRIVLGGSLQDFGYALRGQNDQLSNLKCWHGSETSNPAVIAAVLDKVSDVEASAQVNDAVPLTLVRFSGAGRLEIGMTVDMARAAYPNLVVQEISGGCRQLMLGPGDPATTAYALVRAGGLGLIAGITAPTAAAITDRGVGVRSSFAEVRAAYSDLPVEEFDGELGHQLTVQGSSSSLGFIGSSADDPVDAVSVGDGDFVAGQEDCSG